MYYVRVIVTEELTESTNQLLLPNTTNEGQKKGKCYTFDIINELRTLLSTSMNCARYLFQLIEYNPKNWEVTLSLFSQFLVWVEVLDTLYFPFTLSGSYLKDGNHSIDILMKSAKR